MGKVQQIDTNKKIKLKDTIIYELQLKVQHLEGSIHQTTDVDTIESAKQKVYEARMDAKAVREKLIVCERTCEELQETNDELMNKNMQLSKTNTKTEDLEKKIVERTRDAHEWKSRAETAERQLLEVTKSDNSDRLRDNVNISNSTNNAQDMYLQKAVGRNNNNNRRWLLFGGSTNNNGNTATNVGGNNYYNSNSSDIASDDGNDKENDGNNTMINQIQSLHETIKSLQSEIVQLSSKQKEELYIQKKKILQLEGENEALGLQNMTLEKLSRFHNEE